MPNINGPHRSADVRPPVSLIYAPLKQTSPDKMHPAPAIKNTKVQYLRGAVIDVLVPFSPNLGGVNPTTPVNREAQAPRT